MEIHPNAKQIFSSGNIALLWGDVHKALRRSFLPLFSRKAMNTYLPIQEATSRETIKEWMETVQGEEVDIRHLIRPLTLKVSQRLLVGNYLEDPKKFGKERFEHSKALFLSSIRWLSIRVSVRVRRA
mmetsp:Transcript_21828/g.88897  ORF Transcript_21828/g.88897 Transcript_21828/m.88897 type:complete len:127 (-) Transcript_21828:1415-1795(-)